MKEIMINGIDVSECCCFENNRCLWSKRYYENNNVAPPCEAVKNCYFKQLKRLQEENEKIKKQYNCYACGNCNGTEDYINLEKHHKGLRKQFDELVKRNNTLSLRIEELEKENEKLKIKNEQLKKPCLVMPKVKQLAVPIEKYEKLYKAIEEIRNIAKPIKENTCFGMYCGAIDWILNEVDEVLNDRD